MARIAFTAHLRDYAPPGETCWPGTTIRAVLDQVHKEHPRLLHYLLDDQGRVRKHVAVYLDGRRLSPQSALQTPVDEDSEIYIFQALSGG